MNRENPDLNPDLRQLGAGRWQKNDVTFTRLRRGSNRRGSVWEAQRDGEILLRRSTLQELVVACDEFDRLAKAERVVQPDGTTLVHL